MVPVFGNNQQGRSMIEMLGVLAVVGMLSVGGIAGYAKAMEKYRTNELVSQLTQISTTIRSMYHRQASYGGLSSVVLKKTKVLPEKMWTSTDSNNPRHGFGGELILESGRDPSTFVIILRNLPSNVCVELASIDWGNAENLAAVAASSTSDIREFINYNEPTGFKGAKFAIGVPNGSTVSTPLSPAIAAKACGGAQNKQANAEFALRMR